MSRRFTEIENQIRDGIARLIEHPEMEPKIAAKHPQHGDLLVINNSFIYRDEVTTTKNSQYLAMRFEGDRPDTSTIGVCELKKLDEDFRVYSVRSSDMPIVRPLHEAVQSDLGCLGQLVFMLIGGLRTPSISENIQRANIEKLTFEPSQAQCDVVANENPGSFDIVINQLVDPDGAWDEIVQLLLRTGTVTDHGLYDAYSAAFTKLAKKARMLLTLPRPGAGKSGDTLLARVIRTAESGLSEYKAALAAQQESDAEAAMAGHRDVLRIAWNFADDALKVIKLLMEVSDLKAIVLWCTISEHFELSEAFRTMPRSRANKKPKYNDYKLTVGSARNRAFHNFLDFDLTVAADLSGVQIAAKHLTLFPPHGTKGTAFEYEDKEIVEVMSDLTRSPEKTIPVDFWSKNVRVIESFLRLLKRTEDTLWELNRVR